MVTKSRFWKKVHRIVAEPLDELCPALFRGFHDWTAAKAWGPEKPEHAASDFDRQDIGKQVGELLAKGEYTTQKL